MTPFYYVREIEKIYGAVYDMFDNLRVNKYADSKRKIVEKTVAVPLVPHYSPNFANYMSSTQSKQILSILPVAGLRYTGDQRDDSNMAQPTYAREIYCRDQDFWIRDIQPRAYVYKFELTILCSNTSDFWQLKENIQAYFQTYRTVRIKEFDFCPEIERPIPVCITGWSEEIADETDLASMADGVQFKVTYQIEAHGVMHQPYMIPAEIRYAEMNYIVNKEIADTEQILVYPDEIARQRKKLWETICPSIREGYSLLKTMARTLIRKSGDGDEEYWSDETLRYTMLTYNEVETNPDGTKKGNNPIQVGYTIDEITGEKVPVYDWEEIVVDDVERPTEVPSFDLLHLKFDDDMGYETDFSGLGRDFVAINDANRRFVPDIPPGNGSDAPDGYMPVGTEFDGTGTGTARKWSQILDWFGNNPKGTIESSYTFKATLQFKEDTPGDTIFQYLYNPEDVELDDGTVIPVGEVWFDWGIMDSRLYFTYHTTSLHKTFRTGTYEFDKEMIYSFYFVLYNSGANGMFGIKTNLNDSMVAIPTEEVK